MNQEINVYFDPNTSPVSVHVDKEVEKGKPNEYIYWNFLVMDAIENNSPIVKVGVKFKNLDVEFFGKKSEYAKLVVEGHSQIYGKVPRKGNRAPTSEKYTVYGIHADGHKTELDPSVIIDEP